MIRFSFTLIVFALASGTAALAANPPNPAPSLAPGAPPFNELKCVSNNVTFDIVFQKFGDPTLKVNPVYLVTIENGDNKLVLMTEAVCYAAIPVDVRVVSCFDLNGNQFNNVISTNLLAANAAGYQASAWSSTGAPLNAATATHLGLGSLDAAGVARMQIPYIQTAHPIISGTVDGYCQTN